MEEKEIWKDVVGYEGYYQASNLGRVRSLDRIIVRKNGWKQTLGGKILKQKTYPNGYKFVHLTSPQNHNEVMVHRLVACAFVPNPDALPVVNHKDCCKSNNAASNLEWCTQQYNCCYGNAKQKKVSTLKRNGYIKDVYQFSLDGTLIARFPSIKKAEESTGITNISAVCRGRQMQAGGFVWSFSSSPQSFTYGKTTARIVCFVDNDGKIVEEYPSLRKAAVCHNLSHNKISQMCKNNHPNWKLKYAGN